MEHRKYGASGATEGRGMLTLLHIGLRGRRLPQGQNGTFSGRGNAVERGVLTLAYAGRTLDVFGDLDLSEARQGMHGSVSLTHRHWGKDLE